jgi:hypothetical protein
MSAALDILEVFEDEDKFARATIALNGVSEYVLDTFRGVCLVVLGKVVSRSQNPDIASCHRDEWMFPIEAFDCSFSFLTL